MTQRVVVTGMSGLCPVGKGWEETRENVRNKKSGVGVMPEWGEIKNMKTRLGAVVKDFERPKHYSRKKVRTMGRVSLLAARATELALEDAGLLNDPCLKDGTTGVSYGSTYGSPPAFEGFVESACIKKDLDGINASQFIQFMSHTCVANLSQFFEFRGRNIPTTCACTAGSQGIVYGYEAIKYGLQDVMVTGGSEEMHFLSAAVFDVMYATSTKNDAPTTVPRPFDKDRDGLGCGEGSATLILEPLEKALARGATIYAEIAGAATNCDGAHVVNPSKEGMKSVMELCLKNSGISKDQIAYVNMHGTSTSIGDIAESAAAYNCFGRSIPATSLKSYMGHTLGACGAIEAWIGINAMREGWIPPTINLENIDPECAPLDYVTDVREQEYDYFMSNNFAFGGVNTSLIFKRWTGE